MAGDSNALYGVAAAAGGRNASLARRGGLRLKGPAKGFTPSEAAALRGPSRCVKRSRKVHQFAQSKSAPLIWIETVAAGQAESRSDGA